MRNRRATSDMRPPQCVMANRMASASISSSAALPIKQRECGVAQPRPQVGAIARSLRARPCMDAVPNEGAVADFWLTLDKEKARARN
jgi:hypothetical protein